MSVKRRCFYEFGEFRLDPDDQLLTRNSCPIPLAPKAFDLLVLLAQNSGRLVTKDQIMQAVWPGSVVEEANLTVTVSTLRKALGERVAHALSEPGDERVADQRVGRLHGVALAEVDELDARLSEPPLGALQVDERVRARGG